MSDLAFLKASADANAAQAEATVRLIQELRAAMVNAQSDAEALAAIKATIDAATTRLASA